MRSPRAAQRHTAARTSCSSRRSAPAASAQRSTPPRAGVEVAGVVEDASPGKRVYDPGNPAADAQGYVTMPNVDSGHRDGRPDRRVARLRGQRHAMQTAKTMFSRTLDILK